jgi:hypothetical protein
MNSGMSKWEPTCTIVDRLWSRASIWASCKVLAETIVNSERLISASLGTSPSASFFPFIFPKLDAIKLPGNLRPHPPTIPNGRVVAAVDVAHCKINASIVSLDGAMECLMRILIGGQQSNQSLSVSMGCTK